MNIDQPPAKNSVLASPLFGYAVLLLVGYAIVTSGPEDTSQLHPITRAIVERLTSWIPSIDRWATYSDFPERTRLFFCYLWATSPVFCWILFRFKEYEVSFLRVWISEPQKNPLRAISLIFATILATFISVTLAFEDVQPCVICVNSSMWSQTLIGSSVVYSVAGCAATLSWLIKNWKLVGWKEPS